MIPFLGVNQVHTITRQFLQYADGQLDTGKFRGIGELNVRHYERHGKTPGGTAFETSDRTLPMDSPGVLDLMCLAAKHNVPLLTHMETETETVAALQRALERYPQTKVIWGHQHHSKQVGGATPGAGKGDPGELAALMAKYPNLYADLAAGLGASRQVSDTWKNLYEQYSDRFVLGLDLAFPSHWQEPEVYRGLAELQREWLSQLSPQARRKFAHENIERILAAKPASVQTCQFLTK